MNIRSVFRSHVLGTTLLVFSRFRALAFKMQRRRRRSSSRAVYNSNNIHYTYIILCVYSKLGAYDDDDEKTTAAAAPFPSCLGRWRKCSNAHIRLSSSYPLIPPTRLPIHRYDASVTTVEALSDYKERARAPRFGRPGIIVVSPWLCIRKHRNIIVI